LLKIIQNGKDNPKPYWNKIDTHAYTEASVDVFLIFLYNMLQDECWVGRNMIACVYHTSFQTT
jgi:hypothetical protein